MSPVRKVLSSILAVASIALGTACSQPSPPRAAVAPTLPQRDPGKRCSADADCGASEICQPTIIAGCPTCDGGPVVLVCRPAPACADDSNCTAPRTCREGGCR